MGAPSEEAIPNNNQVVVGKLQTSEEYGKNRTVSTNLDVVEKILGYEFNNKNLLEEAFTHSSLGETYSYERLEYVGDAVLNLLYSTEHYSFYPNLPPGPLTLLRAANVDTEKLARVSIRHGFHRFLRHSKPLLDDQIKEFGEEISKYPLHSNGLIDVPKNLADIVESIIGAIYIDSNSSLQVVWKVFKDILEPHICPETIKRHPVSELHELCQKNNLKLRFVDLWEQSTTVNVYINDQLVGSGSCGLKKDIANNRAAKDALNNVRRLLCEKDNLA